MSRFNHCPYCGEEAFIDHCPSCGGWFIYSKEDFEELDDATDDEETKE